MSKEIEFGSRDAANAVRDEYGDYVCPVDDDRRMKTVWFVDDTPDDVLERIRARAADSRETEQKTPMAELSQADRDRISELGGFEGNATHKNWQKAKGVFQREGLTDKWQDALGFLVDYEDPQEGAEAWIQQARQADATQGTQGASGGARDEGLEGVNAQQKAAESARTAMSNECDHAHDHCKHGDPDACEFLKDTCGYDDEEVESILSDEEATESEEITGEAAGALGRAWQGYKAGISRFEQELKDAKEAKQNAEQAAAAINAIRAEHGQEPMEFERLEELSDQLALEGETAHEEQGHVETR